MSAYVNKIYCKHLHDFFTFAEIEDNQMCVHSGFDIYSVSICLACGIFYFLRNATQDLLFLVFPVWQVLGESRFMIGE